MTREEFLKEIKTKEWDSSIYVRDKQVMEFCKENLTDELRDDTKVAQVLVLLSPLAFYYLSPRLQQDDQFINFYVTRKDFITHLYSFNDYYEGEQILNNKKVGLAAINSCWPTSKGMILEELSMHLRNDPDVVYAAITNESALPLVLATGKLKNNSNFLIKCMMKNPSSIEYFSNEAISNAIATIKEKMSNDDNEKYSKLYELLNAKKQSSLKR